MATLTTTRTLRIRHRARVLRRLLQGGETTRGALARASGLSTATITNVVADLIDEGLVGEVGHLPSDGGRPKARIAVVPEGAFFAGAAVSEFGVTVEIFDATLEMRAAASRRSGANGINPAQIPAMLRSTLGDALARAGNPKLRSLGLGLPGVVENGADPQSLSTFAQSRGWPRAILHDFVNTIDIPVLADNNSRLLAKAEMWSGAAQGVTHGAVALLGRGVGLGIIIDGKLYRGHASNAGEWGHTKILMGGRRCICGASGCLDAYVGTYGLAQRWRDAGGPAPSDDVAACLELFARDTTDPIAAALVDEMVEALSVGISNLINLLNPAQIVVSGEIGLQLPSERVEQVEARAQKYSLIRPGQQFRLVRGSVPGDAVAFGAALLGIDDLIGEPLVGA